MREISVEIRPIMLRLRPFKPRGSGASVSGVSSSAMRIEQNLILNASYPGPSTERQLSSNQLVVHELACRVGPERTGFSGTQTSRMVGS